MSAPSSEGIPPSPDARTAEHIAYALMGFEPIRCEEMVGRTNGERLEIDWGEIPVPMLVYGLLVKTLGYSDFGRDEKLMWEVPFRYRHVRCSLAFEKFGLRLYVPTPEECEYSVNDLRDSIVSALNRALSIYEKHVLRRFASDQILIGNFTIMNQWHRLTEMYEYFRGRALDAHEGRGKLHVEPSPDDPFSFLSAPFDENRARGEALFCTVAMLTAYFSRLEHVSVLILPFTDSLSVVTSVTEFVGAKWGDKFRTVFDLKDCDTKHQYDSLLSVPMQN